METFEQAHGRIQGIFRTINLELALRNEIAKIGSQIKSVKHAETKRVLMHRVGELRERLYDTMGDPKEKKLAERAYWAAQYGFKKYE